jgi:hypothetical protein
MTIEFRRGTGCALLSPIGRGAYHDAMVEEVSSYDRRFLAGLYWVSFLPVDYPWPGSRLVNPDAMCRKIAPSSMEPEPLFGAFDNNRIDHTGHSIDKCLSRTTGGLEWLKEARNKPVAAGSTDERNQWCARAASEDGGPT